MTPLTDNNIKSELSYASLHAVAARAGVGCTVTGRHDDNAGVDAMVSGLAPTHLRDYLKYRGWRVLSEALRDRLFVLDNAQLPRRQLVFPMDESAPDYVDSVNTVVHKLGEIENLSPANVLNRLHSMNDDVLSVRVISANNRSTLPLDFAANLVANTEKLLRAAACTVLRPRLHHPRLSMSEATRLAEQSRFQQTEKGSFVVKVACPIHALDTQPSLQLDPDDAPFVRQTTLGLQRATQILVEAIEADTLADLMDRLKADRVPLISSNLCDAIGNMQEQTLDNALDFGFDWSILRAPPAQTPNRPIQIKRDYFSRIEEVRRELRAVETPVEDTFYGTVERLDGDLDDSGRRSGDIILALLLPESNEVTRAKLTLEAENYLQALEAHRSSAGYIRVKGQLHPGRQPRQLLGVTLFERC